MGINILKRYPQIMPKDLKIITNMIIILNPAGLQGGNYFMARQIRIAAFLCLLLLVFRTSASADSESLKAVHLTVDGEKKSYSTYEKSVSDFLKSEGIELNEKDKINMNLSEELSDATPNIIKIEKAFQVFISIDENKPFEFYVGPDEMAGHIIQELKAEKGITYHYDGYLNDAFTEGETIHLNSRKVKEFTVVEKTPFETEEIQDPEILEGEISIERQGELGEVSIIYDVSYEGDVEVSRQEKARQIVKEPVNEIKKIGTKKKNPLTPGGEYEYTNVITMEATAYSAQQPSLSNYTSLGHKAVYGVIAVDPNVIPLGTWVYVEGYGKALASDTGGAIKGNKIDLCYNTVNECYSFGRRNVKVYILAEQ